MTLLKQKTIDEKIAYFNGFLSTIAILDTIACCAMCEYFIEPIEDKGSIDATLQHHYTAFFMLVNAHVLPNTPLYSVENIEYLKLQDWQEILKHTIQSWCIDTGFGSNQFKTVQQQSELIDLFMKKLANVFSGAVEVWEVFNGVTDVYYKEYIFGDTHQYFLLHFGIND